MTHDQSLNLKMGIKETEDWYFGPILRDQANEILLKGTVGMYLVRASSEPGNFAISVRDKIKVNHYKIIASKRQHQDGYKFKIGQLEFISIHHIIEYYKKNKLGDSSLTGPAPRLVYRAKFDYKPAEPGNGEASERIALRRNDSVLVIDTVAASGGTENVVLWRVLNRTTGEVGYVPLNCLRQISDELDGGKFGALRDIPVPFDVEVMRARNPNIFDQSQLRLVAGDTVRVLQVIQDQPDMWYGCNMRTNLAGVFPFNYVRPLSDSGENCRYSGVSSHSAASSRCGGGGGGGGSGSSGNRASQMSGGALDEHQEMEAAA